MSGTFPLNKFNTRHCLFAKRWWCTCRCIDGIFIISYVRQNLVTSYVDKTATLSIEKFSFSLLTGEEEKTTESGLKEISKHHLPKLITAGNAKMIVSHLNRPRSNNRNSNKFFRGPGFALLYFILNILKFENPFRRRQNEIASQVFSTNESQKSHRLQSGFGGLFGNSTCNNTSCVPTLQKGTPITISYCDGLRFKGNAYWTIWNLFL